MQRLLTGAGTDLSTIYIHHACTATLIIWLLRWNTAAPRADSAVARVDRSADPLFFLSSLCRSGVAHGSG